MDQQSDDDDLAKVSDGRLVMMLYDTIDLEGVDGPNCNELRAEIKRRGLTDDQQDAAVKAQQAEDAAERRAGYIDRLARMTVEMQNFGPEWTIDGQLARENPEVLALAEIAFTVLEANGAKILKR